MQNIHRDSAPQKLEPMRPRPTATTRAPAEAILDPSKAKPVGWKVIKVDGKPPTQRRTPFPLDFRSPQKADEFRTHLLKDRPHLTLEVKPVYSRALVERYRRVRSLVATVTPLGNRRYLVPSRSEPGTTYRVDPHFGPGGYNGDLRCNCQAGSSGATCDHVLAALILERSATRNATEDGAATAA